MSFYKFISLGLLIFYAEIGSKKCFADDCREIKNGDALPQDQFILQLTDPCRYDKYEKPKDTKPLNINVTLDITHLDAEQTKFTTYMTLHFVYVDERLNFATTSPKRGVILGDESLKAQIWTPNLVIIDQTDTTIMGIQTSDVLVSISQSGVVSFSYKVVAVYECWMNLKKFPFDHQKCDLAFTDWSYNASHLHFNFNKMIISKNLHLTEFVMDEVTYGSDDEAEPPVFNEFLSIAGRFSELTVKFKFHRDVGYYLLDFFIPSYLLVLTAWVTFWLQADAGPPRATLGASTIVAFITLHLGVAKDIPKVSYVKASDVWFLGVICFIFLSLAEFAFVNVIWRRKKQVQLKKDKPKYILKGAVMPKKARKDLAKHEKPNVPISTLSIDSLNSDKYQSSMNSRENLTNGHTSISIGDDDNVFTWTTMTPQEVAIYVDRKARIVFPIAFLIFNILYWVFVYYL